MTTARERAFHRTQDMSQRFQCRRTVNPVFTFGFQRMHGVKDNFVDIRPEAALTVAASVPSTNGAAHKLLLQRSREPAIPAQFQHSIMATHIHHDQHMVGIGNRFYGLITLTASVPMGFCGSSIPAARRFYNYHSLTSDGLIHRHLLQSAAM